MPRHLQNVHADSAGSAKAPAYRYPHNYPHHYVRQQYLPDALKDAHYYDYGENKTEQARSVTGTRQGRLEYTASRARCRR